LGDESQNTSRKINVTYCNVIYSSILILVYFIIRKAKICKEITIIFLIKYYRLLQYLFIFFFFVFSWFFLKLFMIILFFNFEMV
jgi:hypothetical protein